MARFLREGLRVPPERLRVIFNGAPLPQVRPLPTVVRTMTYVGQLGPVKSVGTLLEALALLRPELPDLHLRIVGDGPLRAELEARADRPDLAGGVSFVGYRTDVPAQLALADAFVLPSVNENQPLALLEAMGAGLACVASHVGGIPEVLADTGLLVPPGDAPALARALRRLAMERGLAADLGNRAAERARDRYSIARCADSHLELYGELVATGRSPSMDRLPSRSRAGRWPVVAPVPTVPTSAGGRPSFSVVIAAYQAAGTVGAAVESALTQTYSPLEVIVCDDGSTDDIAGALQSYRGRIRLIHKDNGGESSAKNSAAAVASGDFVVLLDADDSWMPRRLEALAALSVARPDLDILTTNATVMVNGEDAGPYYPLRTRFDVDDQRIAILGSNFVFGSCAIRRYRWEGLGGFDESLRIAADWDLIQRLILTGSLAGVLDLPLARYNLSRASLSGDEVGLWRHRIELTRSALVRYQLRPAERQVCNRQVAHYERELRLAQARRAVREGIPDARRLSIAVVGSPDYGLATRAKALTAALLPAVAASLPPPDRLQ
jgi:glycosyltransferase involved in cell wall biosynthesis